METIVNEATIHKLNNVLKNKAVLFVTTKNLDYIRNTQELDIISEYSKSVDIIGSNSKSYIYRIFNAISKSLFRKNEYDVIFVGFAPQLLMPFIGKRFNKCSVVIDFFISFYDTLVYDRKKFSKNGLIAKLLYKLDAGTIRKADMILADTESHKDYFVNEFGVDESKIQVLYIKANEKIYYPRSISKPPKWSEKYIVLYFGSILPLQGVRYVIQAAKSLSYIQEIQFEIIGPIKDEDKVESDNIAYIDWLPQKELAEHIAYADLCLAGHFSPDIEKAERTIPGKAYIYESMKKKMILGNSTANHEIFAEDEYHYFVNRGNADQLAEIIKKICSG